MSTREVSKKMACGVALILWPIVLLSEMVILKKVAPQMFIQTGGISRPGESRVFPTDEVLHLRFAGVILVSLALAILLAWILYETWNRKKAPF